MAETRNPVDWQALLKLTNNKADLAKELLGMFAAELPELKNAINRAHDQGNLTEFKDLVHKLHGSCCYTGVTHLRNLSRDLEESIKMKNISAIDPTLTQINDEIERVIETINNESYANE